MTPKRKETAVQSKAEFIKDYLSLIQTIAAQVTSHTKLPPGFTFDDLVSFGVEGLIKAWGSYDSRKGAQFKTYASYRVRGEMLDRIREEWRYRNFVLPKVQKKIVDFARETLEFSDTGKGGDKLSEIIANSAIVYMLSLDSVDVSGTQKGMGDPQEEVIDEVEFSRQRTILRDAIDTLLSDEEKKIVEYFYNQEMSQKEIASFMELSRSKVNRMLSQIHNKLRQKLKTSLEEVRSDVYGH